MAGPFKIDGTDIKRPTKFHIEKYNITKAGRVADGTMKLDLVAKKRKFLFRYEVISGTALNTILGLIDTSAMFFTLTYDENGATKTATCYAGHIPAELFRTDGVWYWRNVNFDLIEQ